MSQEIATEVKEENKMGTMPVGKLIFNMSLPMMVSMLVHDISLHTISEARLLSVIFWTVSPVRNLPKKVY